MIPQEAPTLDTVFRCTQFACVLTHKACLRRQFELWKKPGRTSKGKRFVVTKPLYTFCAGGACEQGNAIRATHPEHIPPTAPDPRSAPRLDLVNQETDMPPGKPKTKRTCCESTGTRHMKTCPTQQKGAKGKPPSAPRQLKSPFLVRSTLFDAAAATVEQLVETIATCRAELADRRERVAAQLRAIETSMGNVDQPALVASASITARVTG